MAVKITNVAEVSDVTDQGRTIPAIRVQFTVGAHGPFSIQILKKDFSSTLANQKIQEFAQHIQQLQGVS